MSDQQSDSDGSPDNLPKHFQDLCSLDIVSTVNHALASSSGDLFEKVKELVTCLSHEVEKLGSMIKELIEKLCSGDMAFMEQFLAAIGKKIEENPWHTAFFVIGIILMCNPLGMAGFGPMGPVAGSIAAAWQSSIGGSVAAGSAFATLQSWGMMFGIAIPAIGAAIAGASAATMAFSEHAINDTSVAMNEAGKNTDQAFQDAGKGLEEASNEAGNQLEQAGKQVEEGVEPVKQFFGM